MTASKPIDEKTDEELAREARAGSRRSFEELALRYKRRLFVFLRSRLGSDQDAEDMVQETFFKLYRNIGNYDPAFLFSTWLYTSANRLAISSYRQRKTAERRIEASFRQNPEDPAAERSDESAAAGLWSTAKILGGEQYRALWLRYGEDLSIDEIAATLGKSRLTVRVLLHRARMNLMKRQGDKPCSAT
jgi:RNA polymerase sigma-70 factor (ECF subfamily)